MSSINLICFMYPILSFNGTHTSTYYLPGFDFASGHKVARTLETKKASKVAFVLEAIYKSGGVFKYLKVFQCDNGSQYKNVIRLLEKHYVDILRITTKYKHTHTAFVESFSNKLTKQLFKPMDVQELQDPEKVSTIWVKKPEKHCIKDEQHKIIDKWYETKGCN